MKLSGLAKLAIDTYGGLDRWRQFKTVSARLLNGGVLWPLKSQQGILDVVHVRPAEHRQPRRRPDLLLRCRRST